MSQVENSSSLSQIMDTIDLGPTSSLQLMFAKLQLAQSELCKNQAEAYMEQIENIQAQQEEVADMIKLARECQEQGKAEKGVGQTSHSGTKVEGKDCYPMPDELIEYMDANNLPYPNGDGDYILGEEEWDVVIKSLTDHQEAIGIETQTLMVYLQDFIGQYNSYLQGANTQIANANQTLTNLARGQ